MKTMILASLIALIANNAQAASVSPEEAAIKYQTQKEFLTVCPYEKAVETDILADLIISWNENSMDFRYSKTERAVFHNEGAKLFAIIDSAGSLSCSVLFEYLNKK